eukprot:TRINITY_DN13737_c0_g1_i6.p1 TRINITY_DN13737_c0_g1~~TRINITY_DN13737_c0_g1_i6.p1  ORF type:complete len:732 (+),score=60.14 TRINITY_DN13737_c0_g1_i6:125-2320(+)
MWMRDSRQYEGDILPGSVGGSRPELDMVSFEGSTWSEVDTGLDEIRVPRKSTHDEIVYQSPSVEVQAQAVTSLWSSPPWLSSERGSLDATRVEFNPQPAQADVDVEMGFGVRGESHEPTIGHSGLFRESGKVAWVSPRRPFSAGSSLHVHPSIPKLPLPSPVVDSEPNPAALSDRLQASWKTLPRRSTWAPSSFGPPSCGICADDTRSSYSDPTFARTCRISAVSTPTNHSSQGQRCGRSVVEGFGAATLAAVEELGISGAVLVGASRFLAGVGRCAADTARSVGNSPSDDAELEQFLCVVCIERKDIRNRLSLKGCHVAEHRCCLECAASFFGSRIEHGRVFELQCPIGAAEGGCRVSSHEDVDAGDEAETSDEGESRIDNSLANSVRVAATASREEVETVLANDPAMLEKYLRFLRTKEDSSLRECPECFHLCSPELGRGSVLQKDMCCLKCGCEFCYYHASAHRGSSCEEYEVRLAAETHCISELFGTKDCPRCAMQTIKTGGCNHMTCQVCRCDWCWVCGVAPSERGPNGEDPMYWHFCDDNIDSGCQQFIDIGKHPDAESVRNWRRERKPGPALRRIVAPAFFFSVSLVVFSALCTLLLWGAIYIPALLVATLIERILIHVCGRADSYPIESGSFGRSSFLIRVALYPAVGIGAIIFIVPFCAFSLIWALLSVLIWTPLYLLGRLPVLDECVPRATTHHLRFLATAPLGSVHQFSSSAFARMVRDQ